MANDWTSEMQAQFDQLQQALTAVIKTELSASEKRLSERFDGAEKRLSERFDTGEKRLSDRFDAAEQRLSERFDGAENRLAERFDGAEKRLAEHFDGAEQRLSGQYKTVVEAVRGEVKLLAEAFGGTLDGIRRDIHTLNEKFDTTIAIHAKVLTEHSRDIAQLKELTGRSSDASQPPAYT